MIAAGIDLGGTKIEVQLFDADWQVVGSKRVYCQQLANLHQTIAPLFWCRQGQSQPQS